MEQKTNKEGVEYFYHYTTQDTLCSLLYKYRESKTQRNLIFWASSIYTMNDPQEMKHGVEVFKVLIPFNEGFYEIHPKEKLDIDTLDNEKILSDYSHTVIVISFSGNRDDLAIWALYGDGGHGVILKFSKDLTSYPSSLVGVTKPESVYYGTGSDRIQLFFQIYNKGLHELRSCKSEEQKKKCREKTVSKLYTHLCPFIKTESYQNEKESRLSYYDVPSHHIKFRTSNKNLIPYIEVPIPIEYLEEIILGPCCNFELAHFSIRYLLDCCGLQRVNVSKSSIPYRKI